MKLKKLTISLDAIDINNTWQFYQKLGFEQLGLDKDKSGNPYWIEICRDSIPLMLYQCADKARHQEHQKSGFYNTILYFEVEDIKTYYEHLKKEGLEVGQLENTHYGAIEFYLKDPDGHQLTFGSFS